MSTLLWRTLSEVLTFPLAFAQGTGNTTLPPSTSNTGVTKINLFNPFKNMKVGDLLNTILGGMTRLAIPIVAIMVGIGAYNLITSGGNPGKVSKGKDYIVWAVVGFAVLLLATSVTAIITEWVNRSR